MANFISMDQAKKANKGKSSNFIKGFFDGYNNPQRASSEVNTFLVSGKIHYVSEKTRDFMNGKIKGVIAKRDGSIK